MITRAFASLVLAKLSPRRDRLRLHRPGEAARRGAGGGECISVVWRLADARAAWQELAARSPHYVFQAYDYVALWYETVGVVERIDPLIVCIADSDGRTRCIIPLGIQRRRGHRLLVFLGGDHTDYNAPLCDAEFAAACDREPFDRLWDAVLASLPRVDIVGLQRMPELLPGMTNPMIREQHARPGPDAAHSASPLPASFAAFAAQRDAKYLADTRRQRRRLEGLGPVTFNSASAGREAAEIIDTMLRQKRRQREAIGMAGWEPHVERFYRANCGTPVAGGRLIASRLRVGDETVATNFGLIYAGRFYGLVMAYEGGRWARYSPGRILLQCLVEWCISEGLETFDFTVGDEGYKRFWTDNTLRLYESIYPSTPRGACVMAVARLKQALRRSPWLRPPMAALRNSRLRPGAGGDHA